MPQGDSCRISEDHCDLGDLEGFCLCPHSYFLIFRLKNLKAKQRTMFESLHSHHSSPCSADQLSGVSVPR